MHQLNPLKSHACLAGGEKRKVGAKKPKKPKPPKQRKRKKLKNSLVSAQFILLNVLEFT